MSGCSTHRLIMVTPKLMSCGIYSLIYFVFRFTVSTWSHVVFEMVFFRELEGARARLVPVHFV